MADTRQANPLDSSTYDLIRNRLANSTADLQERLTQLNTARKDVFGALEHQLIANERITTQNNCIARDIVALDNYCLFGYNVHFGLRTDIKISDVFGLYNVQKNEHGQLHFTEHLDGLALLSDETFLTDFKNLYTYYRNTIFSKFVIQNNYLYLIFQLSDSPTDIKAFKWLITEKGLTYIDNRSEHEYQFPKAYGFEWTSAGRDDQRHGVHAHVNIADKVFVETIGGDLTIKIEDNTEDGQGIYNEPVDHRDQTLDDGQYRYADLGNLVLLEIKPYQEKPRYFVYNHKIKNIEKIDSIAQAAVLLPDDQGVIFPSGYYLQTGRYNVFATQLEGELKFLRKTASPNGEDHLYVFYHPQKGLYVLMSYNVIDQVVQTPIICNGYMILPGGEMAYFKTEDEQTRHHTVQLWQTPYYTGDAMPSVHQDTLIYKIGNKDIVRAMAEVKSLLTLLQKEDSYEGLYEDMAQGAKDILDTYYWINEEDTSSLATPLAAIQTTANSAIDEFEKVKQLRKKAASISQGLQEQLSLVLNKVKTTSFKSINDFVGLLTQLRSLRGECVGAKEVRYVDIAIIEDIEQKIIAQNELVSGRAVQFLLDEKALLPYEESIARKEEELQERQKVIELKKLEEEITQIAKDLELLIEVINNLKIEDTAHSTAIIERISLLFTSINQLRASLKNKISQVGKKEAQADFIAQLKLIDQSIINYLDLADTAQKCDEYLTKLSVNLEELEGRFADYDQFIGDIIEKREEVHAAFDARKSSLVEARNRKATALKTAAERIIKSVRKKAETMETVADIRGYFASDLMVNKIRDIIDQLEDLDDAGKAEGLQTLLSTAREDALRKHRDKADLYEEGSRLIKLGQHRFGVNQQPLDLSLVYKDEGLFYHLTGTDFYQPIVDPVLVESKDLWGQEYPSENEHIYRGAFLAFELFMQKGARALLQLTAEDLQQALTDKANQNYSYGYVKGVHDRDAYQLLKSLLDCDQKLGVLRTPPAFRAAAQLAWQQLTTEEQAQYTQQIKHTAAVWEAFPGHEDTTGIQEDLLDIFHGAYSTKEKNQMALYLFEEMRTGKAGFSYSLKAQETYAAFVSLVQEQQAYDKMRKDLEGLEHPEDKNELLQLWIANYLRANGINMPTGEQHEVVAYALWGANHQQIIDAPTQIKTAQLKGQHQHIVDGVFEQNYHDFIHRYTSYIDHGLPTYQAFLTSKKETVERLKAALRLEEFQPRVLSSFVRNKLIDEVYLPLIGDNLAKQLGSAGDNKRTDRMGMLLLVSPPGYGKTTLMEYVANRLGLIFMKINGPTIGHEVTSLDPATAPNAAAREELKKLNLAFEMGDNVMLYLDDIQHCHTELLQRFISLADGTRRVEGVYEGQPKTYDLRAKKFCVIMAGNPYTEQGEKFKIPDMLSNRADIYNLGDIIGETAHLFELSLVENALSSNPILNSLRSGPMEDIYALLHQVVNPEAELNLKANYSGQEINDFKSVLDKIIKIRNTVLKVNQQYINSAAIDDDYRKEPPFLLQGSYRDMNKLVAKVVPIMDDKELASLLLSHYENESQTLTSSAEANLLKYKELTESLNPEEHLRWEEIKTTFVKNNKFKGLAGGDQMTHLMAQLADFTTHLAGIERAIQSHREK